MKKTSILITAVLAATMTMSSMASADFIKVHDRGHGERSYKSHKHDYDYDRGYRHHKKHRRHDNHRGHHHGHKKHHHRDHHGYKYYRHYPSGIFLHFPLHSERKKQHHVDSPLPEIAGTVIGGVIGNQFGKGDGKVIMTATGALLGGVIAHHMDDRL